MEIQNLTTTTLFRVIKRPALALLKKIDCNNLCDELARRPELEKELVVYSGIRLRCFQTGETDRYTGNDDVFSVVISHEEFLSTRYSAWFLSSFLFQKV